MATYEIDTTTGLGKWNGDMYERAPRPAIHGRTDHGVSSQEMDELDAMVGDWRSHGATGWMEYGTVDSPIIRAVNPPDVAALRAYAAARFWTICEV